MTALTRGSNTDIARSNDAVLPIDKSYPGCPSDENGLCAFDTVLAALEKRVKEIDFDYDCFGN